MYQLRPDSIETILPARFGLYWRPKHSIEITEDKDAAREGEKKWRRKDGIRVYMDGSDVDGRVGEGAVLHNVGNGASIMALMTM